MRSAARCFCGARERVASLRSGTHVLAVMDLENSNSTTSPWVQPGGRQVDPRQWVVSYLVEKGWVAREIVHLALEHGSWRDLGWEGAPNRVRSFVRDVSIGLTPSQYGGNVMRVRRRG